ncbi:TniQ family protein [Paraburkholderia sp. MPAMCS5]|uniref:TniQ family protein n=1 Tax=Paraburkholderia sp. MPAMCS5 TaxID=3112563 RepID=UPI002E16DF07|nr:TniQ family protein [Paraburkholderia sp. MPAMCS5]
MGREGLEGRLFLAGKIQEQEDATGFLNRMLDYRSADSRKQLIELLGSASGRFAWSFPSRLQEAIELFPSALPEIEVLIKSHTRYPLFAPFLENAKRRRLYMHHRKTGNSGIASSFGMHDRARFGVCLKCVQEDMEKTDGRFTCWRRAHLIPGATYCAVHQELLYALCESCELGHRRNNESIYPAKKCACGKALRRFAAPKRQKTQDALLAIDLMAVDLMQGTCPVTIEPGLIPQHARSYLLRQGQPARVHLRKEARSWLTDALGEEGLGLLNVRDNTVERLLGKLEDGQYLINPRQNIAFVYTVFGDWDGLKKEVDLRLTDIDAYEASCRYSPARRRSGKDTKADYIRRFNNLDENERKARRTEARQFIREALKRKPSLTRNQLATLPGGRLLYDFALHMDTAWLEKAIPRRTPERHQRKKVKARVAFPLAVSSTSENELADRIYETRDHLVQFKALERITRARLLNNSTNESIPGWAERTRSVRDALEACVDTEESYLERRVGYVCKKVAEVSIHHPYGSTSTYQGLSVHKLTSRIRDAMKWLRKNSA